MLYLLRSREQLLNAIGAGGKILCCIGVLIVHLAHVSCFMVTLQLDRGFSFKSINARNSKCRSSVSFCHTLSSVGVGQRLAMRMSDFTGENMNKVIPKTDENDSGQELSFESFCRKILTRRSQHFLTRAQCPSQLSTNRPRSAG